MIYMKEPAAPITLHTGALPDDMMSLVSESSIPGSLIVEDSKYSDTAINSTFALDMR